MYDIFAQLYPENSKNFNVIEQISVPGYPPGTLGNINGFAELKVNGNNTHDKLIFVNKLIPHSLYDLMIMASDDPDKSSIADLTTNTVRTLLRISYEFLRYISDSEIMNIYNLNGGRFHLCYNYDRDTLDRESGMAIKKFHLHLNYWTAKELDGAEITKLGELSSLLWKRRLLDPLTFLGEKVCYDIFKGSINGVSIMEPNSSRDIRLGLPVGLKIKFDDWNILNEDRIIMILVTLHEKMYYYYNLLTKAFTGMEGKTLEWSRHELLPSRDIIKNINNIDWLSGESKKGLCILANSLRDITTETMEYLKKRTWHRVRHLTMGGLNYSLGFYSQNTNTFKKPLINTSPVYLVIQTKLFADIGGAGMTYMGKIPIVRILRRNGVINTEMIRLRENFQKKFVEGIIYKMKSDRHNEWIRIDI